MANGSNSEKRLRVDDARPDLSIVIPVYEEEEVLPLLLARLSGVLDEMGLEVEVIFVDDGSEDDTVELLARAGHSDPRIKALCLSRNFGHQAAISAGLAEATGAAVVVMDGDLQDPPEAIPALWEEYRRGFDVVYAIRAARPESWPKRIAYAAFYRILQRSVSLPIPLDAGDFGIMSRRVVDVINALPERRRFVRGLRAWAGFRHAGLPIERGRRGAGRPKYSWAKLLGLALDGLVGFGDAPLRWAGALGLAAIAASIVGAIAGIAGLGSFGGSTTHWIALLVGFFGGAQLVAAAILGEYVTRTLEEARGRPASVVRRRIGFDRGERNRVGERRARAARRPG
ncbi:MAG: glycosyltransferase family 2 protein [Isosphaeraceae bacterium]|nr:glycosyltransferase family 2 protein [Isosphaeraceae bacterium]